MSERDNLFDLTAGFPQWLENLKGESDRGAALIAASWLDSMLGTLLIRRLRGDVANLVGRASFSSRIKWSHGVGLISDEERSDLEHIRSIRNEFAHSFQPIDYDHDVIQGHLRDMEAPELLTDHLQFDSLTADKARFVIGAAALGQLLSVRALSNITMPELHSMQEVWNRVEAGIEIHSEMAGPPDDTKRSQEGEDD